MAFIKLNQRLELLEGKNRKNIELEDDNVTEHTHWVIFRHKDHTYKVLRDLVSFIRYSEDLEEGEELEEESEILIG